MIARLLFLLTVLGVFGLLLYWWQTPRTNSTDITSAEADNPEPGYTATNARLVDTGDDGQPLYQLTADRIERPTLTGGDVTLTEPRFDYEPQTGNHWKLRAERGVLPPDGHSAQLTGAVEVQGVPMGSTSELRIRTELLNVDMLQHLVSTPTDVQVDWAGSRLGARGLWANLKTDELRLNSKVHGQYVR